MVEEEWSPAGGLAGTRNSLVSEVPGALSAHRTVGRQLPTKVEAPYFTGKLQEAQCKT